MPVAGTCSIIIVDMCTKQKQEMKKLKTSLFVQ